MFRKHSKYIHIVIFYKWIQLPRKSISRNERSQFIVENTSQWQKQSKAHDCPSKILACWQIFLTAKTLFFSSHSIQLKTSSACVLVAGTQRFFLAGVAKYCSVSQDVTHNGWMRMDHTRILQKEELISCSCMMIGKTIIL